MSKYIQASNIQDIPYATYTTTQRDALSNVIKNTIIYNSTVSEYQMYSGSVWINVLKAYELIQMLVFSNESQTTDADRVAYFEVPSQFNGKTISQIDWRLISNGGTTQLVFDVKRTRAAVTTTIATISTGTSNLFAAVTSLANNTLQTNDLISIETTQAGDTSKGLIVTLAIT